MILPITVFGDPLLRKIAKPIDKSYEGLSELIANMYETMHNADGVGLAAPQVGLSIRLIVVDASPAANEDEPELADFKKVFINPTILEKSGEPWSFEEGCLSLPNIRENIVREEKVVIHYWNENWEEKTENYDGYPARIILHEYDHLEGRLFVDLISPLRKRILKSKLMAIATGKASVSYKIRLPK
jgi:peptide deformylase